MSYFTRYPMTITLSTLGAATAFSTVVNGFLQDVDITIPKAVGASCKVTLTTSSTSKGLLLIANPSTLGATYLPRLATVGTSGQADPSSHWQHSALAQDRVRVNIASSSGLAGLDATVVLTVGG